MLIIDKSAKKYMLTVNCIVENATFTDPENVVTQGDWPITTLPDITRDLPADPSRLTGMEDQNIDGVTAKITWDLILSP